jgi:hypothetical protein
MPERIVVIGNCQAEIVATALGHPALGDRFSATYHFVDLPSDAQDKGRRELAHCTAVLVQDIGNFEDYPLRAAISEHTAVIRFPCLRFASLWPFDGRNGPDDKAARRQQNGSPEFTHFDGLLGRLRSQIPDPAARLEAYRALAVDRAPNVARIHEFEERRLLALDREFGCALGRLVVDRFRDTRLFHATGDPPAALYRKLMQLILDRLGADLVFPADAELGSAEADEVPVHPLVARALGVSWANEATTYRFHGGQVCWEDYVRRYIDCFG